ncbi:MAG: EAL domain-containing protein [Pseudomonadota bacterium]
MPHTLSKEQILSDPELLRRVVREWTMLREAIRESPVLFAVYDENDYLVVWNRSYEDNHPEAFANHREEAEAGTLNYRTLLRYQIAKSVPPEKLEAELDRLVAAQRAGDGKPRERRYEPAGWMRIYKFVVPSGAAAGVAMNIDDLKSKESELEKMHAAAKEAAARLRVANAEIEKLALQDDQTGLPNRRMLERYLAERRRDPDGQDQLCAILHIDLDRFKQVNDTLGHAAGDFVLTTVAKVLDRQRGERDLAARIGGDEFVYVMVDGCTPDRAKDLAESLIAEITNPIDYNGHDCRIGASIGITVVPVASADLDVILPQADLALYRAKERGRGRVEVFDDTMLDELIANSQIAEDLMKAIEREEFVPVYQPQFSASGSWVTGVEVLCRWRKPDGTIVGPDAFLKVVGDLSLIGAIDRAMYRSIRRDLDRLDRIGLLPPSISLNIGYQRLLDGDLIDDLKLLKRPGLTVVVELLETLSLDAPENDVLFAIDSLKDAGIAVEIDDFGSCRASIVSLISVAPHAMKIDRQIVGPGPASENYRRLIKAIVDIGTALDIRVIAEGVETEEHIRMARDLGCDTLQGYALARPMPLDELEDVLDADQRRRHSAEQTSAG